MKMEVGDATQLSLKTVYINLPEYIVNGFDFNRSLL